MSDTYPDAAGPVKKKFPYSLFDCSSGSGGCMGGGCEGFIGMVIGAIVLGLVVVNIYAISGLYYDLKEMILEIWYNERIVTTVLALLVSVAAVAALCYFLAPIVLPILAGIATSIASGSIPWVNLFIISAVITSLPLVVKAVREFFNFIDRCFNGGKDSSFKGTTFEDVANKTSSIALIGESEKILALRKEAREEKKAQEDNLSYKPI